MSVSEGFVVWEPEPTRRGTFSILITCFTTLGICVWSSLHLNIPKERSTWRQNLARKMFWMSIGVLVPEFLIYVALCQYLSARAIRDRVNDHLGFSKAHKRGTRDSESDGSKAEYLLSSFGEAMARDSDSIRDFSSGEDKYLPLQEETLAERAKMGQVTTPGKYAHRWTLVHGFYAGMGGFVYQSQDATGNVTQTVISSQGFMQLLEKRPDLIPDISEDSICDKSKSNGLAKTLLTVQVGWFCINCIARLAQRLPLTLIEISTAAHATCSLFVYGLWWYKPLDVAGPTFVPNPGVPLKARQEGLYKTDDDECTEGVSEKQDAIFGTICITVGLIYGAPHFLAWNSSFATQMELLLWRICTGAVAGGPIFCGIFYLIAQQDDVPCFADTLSAIGFFLSVLVYFPANLYLIAASFRQLFHLPPAAFKLPLWSSYFPHVS